MMLPTDSVEHLIAKLMENPEQFDDEGLAYQLLQRYFAGCPVESLRPLLRDERNSVQRTASFVASELGVGARPIVGDVAKLMGSPDRHTQWYAAEVLAVCATGDDAHLFVRVAEKLESSDAALRRLAMRLVASAGPAQLEAALCEFAARGSESATHQLGLRTIVNATAVDPAEVSGMLTSQDPLMRRYGAIVARVLAGSRPDLLSEVRLSADPDLAKF